MSASPAVPRPAATVVVIRPAATGFEVLLVRRNDNVAFMAGAYVFPGGRVDDADRAAVMHAPESPASRFADLSRAEEDVYRHAAVRELQEEASVEVDPASLVPLAHWVTPDIEPRRYDTRFFLVGVPADQRAEHDAGETTALAWLTPAAAIEACRTGAIMLPPPTWTTLKWLGRFESVASALAGAGAMPIVRVQPYLVKSSELTCLMLPGDPTHPADEPWDVAEDTRFVLREGRWTVEPAVSSRDSIS